MIHNTGTNRHLRILSILLLSLSMLAWGKVSEAGATCPRCLVIQPNSSVDSEIVTLADLALQRGDLNGSIRICTAPAPGRAKKLSGQSVLSIIRSQQTLPADYSISIPEFLTVQRRSQTVPEGDLEELLYIQVTENSTQDTEPLRDLKIRGNTLFPTGELELEPVPGSFKESRGKVQVKVTVSVDSKPMGRLHVSAMADRFTMAACTTREISRGEILRKEDIVIKRVNLSSAPRGLLVPDEHPAGKAATRRIRAGALLRKRDIESPPLIRKGDRISLVAKSGRLTVVATGIAKSNGTLGEEIHVKNISSKKTVTGRVVNSSTVEVLF